MTALAERPSSWEGGIHPIGAISGRPVTSSAPVVREVREVTSHRRSGLERLELVAAGIGGGLAMLLLIYLEKKVLRRG